MQISLIRHGKAEYKNIEPTQDRENARDIDPKTLDSLGKQAQVFVSKMRPKDTVTIWSSPIPRALETSKIFEDELVRQGKHIRKVKIFDVFEEVRGFKFSYLNALVNGDILSFDGIDVVVDSTITNSNQLSLGDYFRNSEWNKLSPEIIKDLGIFGAIVSNMESYDSIVRRVSSSLKRVKHLTDRQHHLLIFTHQCCTDFIVEAVNDYRDGGINPGDSVTLEIRDERLTVTDTPFGSGKVYDLLESTAVKSRNIFQKSS